MPRLAKKITARFLILLLFGVQLMVELAHQHAVMDAGPPQESLAQQAQTGLPHLRPVPPLCLACFFSSANQSFPPALTFIVSFSPVTAIAPIPPHFFSQYYQISSRNRAPPSGERA